MRVSVSSLYGGGCMILDPITNDPCVDWSVTVRVTLTDPVTGARKSPKQIWSGVADGAKGVVPAAPFVVIRGGSGAQGAGVILRPNGTSDACNTWDTSCYPASFVWSFPTQP
jgi:hypothetical protein